MSDSLQAQSPIRGDWTLVHRGASLPRSIVDYLFDDEAQAEATGIIETLNERFDLGNQSSKIDPAVTMLRKMHLPMLGTDAWLYEIISWTGKSDEADRARIVGFETTLENPGAWEWEALDWSSGPIHDLNSARLNWPGPESLNEAYFAYLRYFCSSMTGDEGTFDLLSLGEAESSTTEEDSTDFIAAGRVFYGDHLFDATFRLSMDGQVEMIDDVPVDADQADEIGPAHKWLQKLNRTNLIPVIAHVLEPATDQFWSDWDSVHCGEAVTGPVILTLKEGNAQPAAPSEDDLKFLNDLKRFDFGIRAHLFEPDTAFVRKMRLPFYVESGAWLYEVIQEFPPESDSEPDPDSEPKREPSADPGATAGSSESEHDSGHEPDNGRTLRRARIVRFESESDPSELKPLDWTSGTMHSLNTEKGLQFENTPFKGRDIPPEEIARRYLRYFCGSLSGDEGTFTIVRFVDGPNRRIDEEDSDASDCFEATAEMLYGSSLFNTRLSLNCETGEVVMIDDTEMPKSELEQVDEKLNLLTSMQLTSFIPRDNTIFPDELLRYMAAPSPIKEFLTFIDSFGDEWTWDEIKISGNVKLGSQKSFDYDWNIIDELFTRKRIQRIRIRGKLDLGDGVFTQGLQLDRWDIRDGLDLAGMKIEGDFRLQNLNVYGKPENHKGINIERVKAPGKVELYDIDLGDEADFSLEATAVEGAFRCSEIKARRLMLVNSRFRGGAHFDYREADRRTEKSAEQSKSNGLLIQDCEINGELNVSNFRLSGEKPEEGQLILRGLKADRIKFNSAESSGEHIDCKALVLSGVSCESLDMWEFSAKQGIHAANSVVTLDLSLRNVRAPSIDLHNATIGGNFCLDSIQGLQGLKGSFSASGKIEMADSFDLGGIDVGGELVLRSIGVTQIDLSDSVCKRNIYVDDVDCEEILLRSVDCKGNVSLAGLEIYPPSQEEDGSGGLPGDERPTDELDLKVAIDLTGLKSGKLSLSGDSFEPDSGGEQGGHEGEPEKNTDADLRPDRPGPLNRRLQMIFRWFFPAPDPGWEHSVRTVSVVRLSAILMFLASVAILTWAGYHQYLLLLTDEEVSGWYIFKSIFAAMALGLIGFQYVTYQHQREINLQPVRDPYTTSLRHLMIFRQLGEATVKCLHGSAVARLSFTLALLIVTCLGFGIAAAAPRDSMLWLGGLLLTGLLSERYARVLLAVSHGLDIVRAYESTHYEGQANVGQEDSSCATCHWSDHLGAWDVLITIVFIVILSISIAAKFSGADIGSRSWLLIGLGAIAVFSVGILWGNSRWSKRVKQLKFQKSTVSAKSEVVGRKLWFGTTAREELLKTSEMVLAFRDWLQIATYNNLKPEKQGKLTAQVSLERSTIGQLEIMEPIPKIIDFTNLKVDHWEFPKKPLNKKPPEGSGESKESEQAEPGHVEQESDRISNFALYDDSEPRDLQFLDLLDHAAEFKSDFYAQIERDLRNKGDRVAAERIHRAVRRQTQWREQRWVQTTLMFMHSLIGYGTKRAPIIGFMLGWFLFTAFWFVADYPEVVGVSPDYQAAVAEIRLAEGELSAGDSSEADKLEALVNNPESDTVTRIGRALALAIRYHVPILAWDIWPYIQPKGKIVWAYTTIVGIVHWILWPLLIASLIPALIPRREE